MLESMIILVTIIIIFSVEVPLSDNKKIDIKIERRLVIISSAPVICINKTFEMPRDS